LWRVYPEWGWGTADSERVLAALKRFGSVTVLNGHIHQVMQKVEGSDRPWRSEVLDTDETFSFTFAEPGTYTYFCSRHPHMTGSVVVTGS
jgi:hypothetical protein